MRNYTILTDSAADLPFEVLQENQVGVIGLVVNFQNKEYIEDNWKSLSPGEYYAALIQGEMPTTSQITPARFMEFFKPYLDKGDDILYIGFSSTLSGTFGSANVARTMLLEEYPERRIELVDSLCASCGLGLLVLDAAAKKAAGMELDDLIRHVEDRKHHVNHIFTVDDLNHLKRGGRLSGFSATMGTMLNIKPILYMSGEGKLLNIDKVKGRKKSLHALVDYLEKGVTDPKNTEVIIAHGHCPEDVEILRSLITEKGLATKVTPVTMGITISAHTGANVINMVFFGKKREDTIKKN